MWFFGAATVLIAVLENLTRDQRISWVAAGVLMMLAGELFRRLIWRGQTTRRSCSDPA